MPQQVRQRQQKIISFSVNNRVSENLSRGMIYRELYLTLNLTPTVAALAGNYAETKSGDEWGVVKKIEIKANGTETIKSFSGEHLRFLNLIWFGTPGRRSIELGDDTADPVCQSTLILPFWMPRSLRPIDTALDSRQLSSLTIEVTWGTFTDVSANATAWVAEPTLKVDSLESFGVTGPFAQWRTWEIEKTITASESKFQIILPVGHVYRSFLLHFTDAGVDDDQILNNFKLLSGSNVFADVREEVLQDQFWIRAGIQRGYSGTAFDDLFQATDSNWGGWYYYDHVTDGFLSEGIDTLGFAEMTMELDVTVGGGTTKVFILPTEIVPVRGNPNA